MESSQPQERDTNTEENLKSSESKSVEEHRNNETQKSLDQKPEEDVGNESDLPEPETESEENVEKKNPEPVMPKPATFPDFTQDPLTIEPGSAHSQIPTPEGSLNGTLLTFGPSEDEQTTPTPETWNSNINPLVGATAKSKAKEAENKDVDQATAIEPSDEILDPTELLAEIVPVKEESTESKPTIPEKASLAPIILAQNSQKDVKLPKKTVSIVPPAPVKVEERHRGAGPMERGRSPTNDSAAGYNENTPLLEASSSLPTLVGYPEVSSSRDYPGPSTQTRSEIGRDEFRRKRKRSKSRRRGASVDRMVRVPIKRPFIASPFMPIPTQLSIDPDRRSIVGTLPRDSNRNVVGYGSTGRRTEEGLLKKAPESSSEDEDDESEEESEGGASDVSIRKASLFDLTHKEWATIIMLAIANLCSTVAFSCIAPFYPTEAKLKGMTETQTGMVFGVFELTMFLTAPIFGRYMSTFGSKKMFVIGLTITGVTAILFGFLNFLPSGTMFFWASLLIRILEAVGDAAFVTSSFAISAKCFPGRITVVIGIMETFAGLGYTAGPLIGGFLYEFGGFQVPFMVLGGILLFATFLSTWLIEEQNDDPCDEDAKGMLAMLRIPVIWIMLSAVVACAISMSFLDPTLAGHLESFKLSPTMVGLMFLLCGGIYTISAPVWGLLIDRYQCLNTIMVFGSVMTVISMLLIGPAPFIPMEKSLFVIGLSLSLLGLAAGAQYIPTFQGCLDAVRDYGYDDSFHTYGCVSGLFQSAFAFGAFFGPTVGGFSVEKLGFPLTVTFIAAVHVFFIVAVFLFYGSQYCFSRRSSRSVSSS